MSLRVSIGAEGERSQAGKLKMAHGGMWDKHRTQSGAIGEQGKPDGGGAGKEPGKTKGEGLMGKQRQ